MKNTVDEKELHSKDSGDEEAINQDVDSNLDAVKEEITDQANEAGGIEAVKNQLAECNNKFMRLSADFQNYKRRIEKEKGDIYKFGSEKIVVDILPIIDNFERAIGSAQNNGEESDGLLSGIEMILKQILDVLEKHGIEEIDALDKEFDPNLHHAVMQEECDGKESDIVIDVLQKGYILNSKVIRPSMVKVSK
ncbi:MAG: nucleotide exchange factor GrpE [Maledivibacter sp.]|jgi:molecular chaperone GrpE|nr:nucleotide exchange factor GrpE [Maledivibacter sp.]